MGVKGRYPFRVGATSYVLPADMLTNVRSLAGLVDDIELLVFESDAMADLPDHGMLCELGDIARSESLSYTVHLPLDIHFGHPDASERERSISKCARTIERMTVADPVAWILHCDRRLTEEKALPDNQWVEFCAQSLATLLRSGIKADRVCAETLDGYFPLLEPVIRQAGVSVCLDIGHLVLYGLDVLGYLERLAERTRVIHLHGVVNGKDHRAIGGVPCETLGAVIDAATQSNTCRVITIEVFSRAELDESLRILEEKTACIPLP
jgi:sugar phosphate isomerase/epimerase